MEATPCINSSYTFDCISSYVRSPDKVCGLWSGVRFYLLNNMVGTRILNESVFI